MREPTGHGLRKGLHGCQVEPFSLIATRPASQPSPLPQLAGCLLFAECETRPPRVDVWSTSPLNVQRAECPLENFADWGDRYDNLSAKVATVLRIKSPVRRKSRGSCGEMIDSRFLARIIRCFKHLPSHLLGPWRLEVPPDSSTVWNALQPSTAAYGYAWGTMVLVRPCWLLALSGNGERLCAARAEKRLQEPDGVAVHPR